MSAVWFRFRTEFRSRWRALLAVALLVGLAGGAALAAVAGARRTDTAFDRMVERTDAWDLLVNPDLGTDSALSRTAIESLPEARTVGRVHGVAVVPADLGGLDEGFDFGIVLATQGGVGYEFARPNIEDGRMPRRDHADEAFINQTMADQQGWRVGDRIDLLALRTDDLTRAESGTLTSAELVDEIRAGRFGDRARVTITGVGRLPDDIVVDEGFENGMMLLAPAFLKRYPDVVVPYWGAVARLNRGARDIASFRRGVEALVPGEAVAFQTLPRTITKVERAVRPAVGALTIFALVIALTGGLVIAQALARQNFLDAADNDALRALGTTRGQLFSTSMLRSAVIAVVGALLAVFLAVLASPLTPIGVARNAEPDPGFDIAWNVLAAGFVVTFLAVLVLSAWPGWRSARARASDTGTTRPSRVVTAVGELGLPVPAAAGMRMALEPGRGRTAVPVRTTVIGAGFAIATVVAAGVFASSLDHLVSTPRLFGWNWDTQVSVNAQEAQRVPGVNARDDVEGILEASPAVAQWGTVSLSDVSIEGSPTPAVGIDPKRGATLPTLVDGAFPDRDDEVALGRLTKRTFGVQTGDRVTAQRLDGKTVELEVVGTVVLPGLGTYPGADKTALGEGAVLTRDELYRLGPSFGRDDYVVKFANNATSADRRAVMRQLEAVVLRVDPEGFESQGLRRPSDIVAYDRVRSTPLVLALVLAVLASATVAHALVSAVRRRRRDLAMLATLGLTRRQISSTVAWQSTTVGVLALVIGIPLGIIGGRWAWGLLADDLGTLSEPRVPVLAIVIGIPVVVLLCNAVAYVPGRIAARMKPAFVLRSE